jgi:MtN3 and saliva related transmembrane protein
MRLFMDIWQIVGIMGIVFTSAQLLPQVIKSIRTRKVHDVSWGLGIIVGLSALTWLIYGAHIRDYAFIVANSINLAGATVILYLKFWTFAKLKD